VCTQKHKGKKGATKEEKEDLATAEKVLEVLNAGQDIRHHVGWGVKDVDFINRMQARPSSHYLHAW
jgi:hypothetical protein